MNRSCKFYQVFIACAFAFAAFLTPDPAAAAPPDLQLPGYRPLAPSVHALVGAKVFVKPGVVIENATIILRDGLIQSVSAGGEVPADARVWDMKGMTIYAGFIDPYLELGTRAAAGGAAAPTTPEDDADADTDNLRAGAGIRFYGLAAQARESGGAGVEVSEIMPEHRVAPSFSGDPKVLEKFREIGFTAGNVVPESGIIRGISAFVALSDVEPTRAVIRPEVFQHISFDQQGRRRGGYPGSLMGVIAAVRQSFFDTQHYVADKADYAAKPAGRLRPQFNPSLEALEPALQKKMRVIFEPKDALMVDRVARIAHEMNLDYCIVASGQEWRRPAFAASAGVPFIVPLEFPQAPRLPTDDDWMQVTLDELRAWDWAPENAALLQNANIEISLTTANMRDKSAFRRNLRLAIDRGLSESNALAALTTVPAKLCGVDQIMGTIEAGKAANLVVTEGKGYFDTDSRVRSVWIDGVFYRIGTDEKEPARAAGGGRGGRGGFGGRGGAGGGAATAAAAPDTKPADDKAPDADAAKTAATDDKAKTDDRSTRTEAAIQRLADTRATRAKELQKRVARSPLEGRGPITNPPSLLIRNATLWTCGPQGVLSNASILISNGKIQQVGNFKAEPGPDTLVIDGADLHVTPGLIDCHSHSMILGGVNEGSLPSTAMVRIGDVVNSETVNIYDQLAGGVTAVNLLHGSANPIGGQNCVIKLRDGAPAEELKFAGAPEGIKFALGENVKQSNGGGMRTELRYPATRMGVRAFYLNRFTAAQQYLKAWDDYKKSGGLAPRRDLELEALGEILNGSRIIHCHSYRQDEILMLIRLMDDFHVKIATFQHGLECYKVADEIAKHGAGVSTFSDWWAYKVEAFDAIPQNGSLLRDRGVVVSFNSDSDDLARRLYLDAAKAVKFGNTPEPEALKFVTLNPAIQLHIDAHVGSLEPGKDGDIAIWSKAPLDYRTLCLQTWIDGKKYFDRSLAPARSEALTKERDALISKAKKMASPGGGMPRSEADTSEFFTLSLEHQFDGIIRHCMDE